MQALEVEVVLAELAAGQWGLFTAQQARQAGVSRVRLSRLTQAGALLRVTHGVYALRGVAGGAQLELRAAWLGIEPSRPATDRVADGAAGVVVSHASAADLYGFGDLDADRHEFTASTRKQTRRPDVHFHRALVGATEITLRDGLPVTTPDRLIVDLLVDGHDGGHVAGVLADAVRARAIAVGDLPDRLAPLAARLGHDAGNGQGLVDELLDLGGVSDLVVADQLSAIARADNKSLAELVITAVANQTLPALTSAITAVTQSPALAEAARVSSAAAAVSKLMQSPAIAQAIQNNRASEGLITDLSHTTRVAQADAARSTTAQP